MRLIHNAEFGGWKQSGGGKNIEEHILRRKEKEEKQMIC